jgi:hypothetical protein
LRVAVAVEVGVEVREAVGEGGRVPVGGEGSCVPGGGSLVLVGEGSFMDGGGGGLNSGDSGVTPPHDTDRKSNKSGSVLRNGKILNFMIASPVRVR